MSRLNSYSRQAANVPAGATSSYPKLDSVPDGTYDWEIAAADLKELAQGDVFELQITALSGVAAGKTVQYSNWLSGTDKVTGEFGLSERAVGRLKEELSVLGFQHEKWPEFDFFAELVKSIPNMVGLRFRGEKSTNGKYHNLKFVQRLPGGAAKPPASTAANEPIPF